MASINRKLRCAFCLPIRIYQYLLSPFFYGSCRFYPSCSNYTLAAINHYGICKGIYLGSLRLLKCHPWSDKGGYDPVIPNDET